jgi:RNA polymerase sigma factor (sigma-70 family)
MANVTTSVARQIESLYGGGSVAGLTDRQLVDRFVARRDAAGEDAFAALVARHGPMVLGVCRQLLVDRQHAEDAFQAVFLVLARRARSVRDPDLLCNWLYGIALRTARKARARLARLRRREENRTVTHVETSSTEAADQIAMTREQAETLHKEINRLPGSFRLPVVLCYFEGLTLEEAAQRLRCPPGTIHSRLVRARERLRRGLTRRGAVLPAATIAFALSSQAARASVSSSLCETTTRAAIQFAAGQAVAPVATALAQEVLKSMVVTIVRLSVLAVLTLGTAAVCVGYTAFALARNDEPGRFSAVTRPTTIPQPAEAIQKNAEGRMIVEGRVLDPDGKPVKAASVDLVGRPRAHRAQKSMDDEESTILSQGETDADGRFRLESPRTSSTGFLELQALAAAPGLGLGWATLNPDAREPTALLRLHAEQKVGLKLVDINGSPAPGVLVRVKAIGRASAKGEWEGASLWPTPPQGLRAWPRSAQTDNQGTLIIAGLVPEYSVELIVSDPRHARQNLHIEGASLATSKEITVTLEPARIIEGRVLAADTGQPIPNAAISVKASFGALGARFTSNSRADDQGRFKASPYSGDYFRVRVVPTAGQPYLVGEAEFAWTKGAVRKELDVKLPRAMMLEGKITDTATGRPVAGASVRSIPAKQGVETDVTSTHDGSFELAVPPGEGYLFILAPSLNFVPKEIGSGKLYARYGPEQRQYAHEIVAYNVKPGEELAPLAVRLQSGKTVHGRLVGPGGQTVLDAVVLTRQQLDPNNLTWLNHTFIHARDGHFELTGIDPDKGAPAYFLDADQEWGAATLLSGKHANEELTIQLEPCGQARARFVGPDGKPVAKLNIWPYFQIIMTPGPDRNSRSKQDRGALAADAAYLPNVDPKHYRSQGPQSVQTDADGKVTLTALIPGAPYRMVDWSTVNVEGKGAQARKDFTVKAGETIDLGDILIEKPQQQ